jgi:hypothetical protein
MPAINNQFFFIAVYLRKTRAAFSSEQAGSLLRFPRKTQKHKNTASFM